MACNGSGVERQLDADGNDEKPACMGCPNCMEQIYRQDARDSM